MTTADGGDDDDVLIQITRVCTRALSPVFEALLQQFAIYDEGLLLLSFQSTVYRVVGTLPDGAAAGAAATSLLLLLFFES